MGDGGPPPKRTPDSVTWTVDVAPGTYYRAHLATTIAGRMCMAHANCHSSHQRILHQVGSI